MISFLNIKLCLIFNLNEFLNFKKETVNYTHLKFIITKILACYCYHILHKLNINFTV